MKNFERSDEPLHCIGVSARLTTTGPLSAANERNTTMKLDVALWVQDLGQVPAAAQAAEKIGFGALWTGDTNHNPLFPQVLAAEHTQRLQLGTSIVVAFARSPMDLAYQAWDLARYSQGLMMVRRRAR